MCKTSGLQTKPWLPSFALDSPLPGEVSSRVPIRNLPQKNQSQGWFASCLIPAKAEYLHTSPCSTLPKLLLSPEPHADLCQGVPAQQPASSSKHSQKCLKIQSPFPCIIRNHLSPDASFVLYFHFSWCHLHFIAS